MIVNKLVERRCVSRTVGLKDVIILHAFICSVQCVGLLLMCIWKPLSTTCVMETLSYAV